LKSLFKISFRKKFKEVNRAEIIDLFLINLKGTLYEKIEKGNDDKIIIKGEFYSMNPFKNVPWNLWTGFSAKAELNFTKDNIIVYSIDYTYGIISMVVGLLFFVLTPLFFSFGIDYFYLGFLVVLISIMVIGLIFKITLHRRIFNKTIRLENQYKGNYDWNLIFKNKSDKELKNIVKGNTTLTIDVQKMAEEELIRRKDN